MIAAVGPSTADPAGLLDDQLVGEIVRRALDEDLARRGDVTTAAVVPPDTSAAGRLLVREEGVLAGAPLAAAVFRELDPRCAVVSHAADGARLRAGEAFLEVRGTAAALLAGERTALNFVGHLAGIATATRRMVDAVAGTAAVVTCTRKTIPGLRRLAKYAVRCGGGTNHRFGLDDGVLIKDNHVAIAGGVAAAVRRARASLGEGVDIEVEVDSPADVEGALEAGADMILLDNMTPDELREAVRLCGGAVPLEASGGVTLETIRAIAESGVDRISVGALTHSAPSLDVAMEIMAWRDDAR